jgi:hypothetical protein
MFAFTGPSFDLGVMKNSIQSLEVGVLDGDVKYCCMHMLPSRGRRESCLKNIVQEYSERVGVAITVVTLAGLPAIIVDAKHPGTRIELQLQKDRAEKPSGYEIWTNDRTTTTGQ